MQFRVGIIPRLPIKIYINNKDKICVISAGDMTFLTWWRG